MKYFKTITYKHPLRVLICFFITLNYCTAQTNLVPNPSFEQYTNCPNRNLYIGTGNPKNVHLITPDIWFKPDFGGGGYFNSCANTGDTAFGVPFNFIFDKSYQQSHSGNAYIGMFYDDYPSTNLREYYEVKLLDSLKAGHCYYAEYYISLSNDANVGCNNQAMLFTKKAVYADTNNSKHIIFANPQIKNYGNPIITDTLNWIKISGVFTAQGGEQYLTLGNFTDGSNTNFKVFQTAGYYISIYYADDVSIYEIDTFKLNADAGADKTIINGDSAFIGSLTNGITNIVWRDANNNIINTQAPGFYVQPNSNTFYTIEQTVCGYTSKDTVYINVILPLNFIKYNVISTKEKSIENVWTTANEINVSHFNIQRSTNSKDFITIGTQKAQNNSYNEYSFTDVHLPSLERLGVGLFYRIQSIDKDGKTNYTEIKRININVKQEINGVIVYPNPASSIINILDKNVTSIQITDMLGKQEMFIAKASRLQTINISSLTNGLHFVKVQKADGSFKISKLIIQH